MKKSIVFLALVMTLSLCLAGCGSTENEENLKVRNYSESYEVSAYGNEEDLNTFLPASSLPPTKGLPAWE